jgi:hypothetical protein
LIYFNQRCQVFQELTRAIAAAFHKPNVQVPDLANFDVATDKARFLFGPKVHAHSFARSMAASEKSCRRR